MDKEMVTISLERYDALIKASEMLIEYKLDALKKYSVNFKEEPKKEGEIDWKNLPIGTKLKCEDADGIERVYYFWQDRGTDLIKVFSDEGKYWYKKKARLY